MGLRKLNKSTSFIDLLATKKENSLFYIYDPLGIKLRTRLRLQFSHLNKHKFTHGLRNATNLVRECETEVETTKHFPYVAIFTVLKDENFLKILRKLTHIL